MKYLMILLAFTFCACVKQPKHDLSEKKYDEKTKLLLDVANKFYHETDVKKLHKISTSIQLGRVGYCFEVKHECSAYADYVEIVRSSTEDGLLSGEERVKIKLQLEKLKTEIQAGREQLMKEREDQ